MTKATLKHVANQYVLIVNEPIVDKNLYSILLNRIGEKLTQNQVFYLKSCNLKGLSSIIAAENLDGVKGIRFRIDRVSLFTSDVSYKNILNNLIDTEVEVTEEEDYYLIRL